MTQTSELPLYRHSPHSGYDESISRKGDMGEGFLIKLTKQDDGDIIVGFDLRGSTDKVMDDPFKSIEFCNSGGRSPKTLKALHALFEAMKEDSEVSNG